MLTFSEYIDSKSWYSLALFSPSATSGPTEYWFVRWLSNWNELCWPISKLNAGLWLAWSKMNVTLLIVDHYQYTIKYRGNYALSLVVIHKRGSKSEIQCVCLSTQPYETELPRCQYFSARISGISRFGCSQEVYDSYHVSILNPGEPV